MDPLPKTDWEGDMNGFKSQIESQLLNDRQALFDKIDGYLDRLQHISGETLHDKIQTVVDLKKQYEDLKDEFKHRFVTGGDADEHQLDDLIAKLDQDIADHQAAIAVQAAEHADSLQKAATSLSNKAAELVTAQADAAAAATLLQTTIDNAAAAAA